MTEHMDGDIFDYLYVKMKTDLVDFANYLELKTTFNQNSCLEIDPHEITMDIPNFYSSKTILKRRMML